MANVLLFVPKLLKFEGGFVDNPNDAGGATFEGITLSTYRFYFGNQKTVNDLKNITKDEVIHIIKLGYWDKILADQINNQSIAEICVDWLYNSGTGIIKNIQSILGITPDGIAGKDTVTAINSANPIDLFNKIKEARIAFYKAIVQHNPSQHIFLEGWMNRINSFSFES